MISILFGLISHTPLMVLRTISFFLTKTLTMFGSKQLDITKRNIKYCFGNKPELIHKSFGETVEMSFMFPYIWGKQDNYKKLLDPEYIEKKSLDNGKPKLFFTLHMGCVDMLVFIMSELLSQINILYTPAKNEKLENFRVKTKNDEQIFGGHWLRGKNCNFIPSKKHFKQSDFISEYILTGYSPKKPFISKNKKIIAFGSCFASSVSEYLSIKNYSVFNNLAYEQWTIEEIKSGECWNYLSELKND